MTDKHKTKKTVAKTLAVIGGTALLRNLLLPMFGDDFAYSFVWDGEERGNLLKEKGRKLRRVRNLKDLWESQVSHYMNWGGRSVAHTVDQAFLIRGKKAFSFANAGMALLQILLAERLGAGTEKPEDVDADLLQWLAGCYWFCTPYLPGTAQWMTGSCNYLWMGVLQNAFALPYRKHRFDKSFQVPAALMAPLGVLTGWSNEAGAGAALLYAGCGVLESLRKKEKLPAWMLSGIAGGCAGLLVMLAAPGNFRRIELTRQFEEPAGDDDPDRTPEELYYTPEMLKHHLKNGFLHTVLRELPMHVPVLLYFTGAGKRTPEVTKNLLSLEAASWAVPCALLLSPEFPERAAYPSVVFGMAASAAALRNLDRSRIPSALLKAVPLLKGALAVSVAAAVGTDLSVFIQKKKREQEIRKHADSSLITLRRYEVPKLLGALCPGRALDTYALQVDLGPDPEQSYNEVYAQYYNVRKIRALGKDER